MSNSVKGNGVVGWVGSKAFNGRTLWSFKIDGIDDFFRTGTVNPKINKGQYIRFEYEVDPKYGNQVNVGSIIVSEQNEERTNKAASSSGTQRTASKQYGKSQEEKDYWKERDKKEEERQNVIKNQSALNSAIATYAIMQKEGIMPVPSSGNKAAKADALVNSIKALAMEYRAFSEGTTSVPDESPFDDNDENEEESSSDNFDD